MMEQIANHPFFSNMQYWLATLILNLLIATFNQWLLVQSAQTFDGSKTIIVSSREPYVTESRNDLTRCNRFQCFHPLRCKMNSQKEVLYYVYPPLTFLDTNDNLLYSTKSMISREYFQILHTIMQSSRFTSDPTQACIFITSIDIVMFKQTDLSLIANLLESLPHWRTVDGKPGTNHLVISLNPKINLSQLTNVIGRAILVSNNHNTWTYRPEFDLAIPLNGLSESNHSYLNDSNPRYQWKLVSTQYNSLNDRDKASIRKLKNLMKHNFLVAGFKCHSGKESPVELFHMECGNDTCDYSTDKPIQTEFRQLLRSTKFCLIMHSNYSNLLDNQHFLLGQSLELGCVPIINSDLIAPLASFIDWETLSIRLKNDQDLEGLAETISSIGSNLYDEMSNHAEETWRKYFQSHNGISTYIMQHYDSFVYPENILTVSSSCKLS